MQNGRERPSIQDFTKMLEAFRRRVPRRAYPTGHAYAAKLMELGLGLDNQDGKDIVITMLAIVAMTGSSMADDLTEFMRAICHEIQMRSLYDDDYKSMDEFMQMIQNRVTLAENAKHEGFKILTSEILKKFMKDEDEATAPSAGSPEQAGTAPTSASS